MNVDVTLKISAFTLIRVVPPRHSVPIVGMNVPAIFYILEKCSFLIYRNIVFGELKQDIANILSMLCKRKEVHTPVEIPPKMRVSL